MGLWSTIRRRFRRAPQDNRVGPFRRYDPHSPEQRAELFTLRRFDAARTNRLNRDHWAFAHGQSINHDIAVDLPHLIARCTHEAANNPLVAGAIETVANDLVGRNGPRLQVTSTDPQFNETVERAWRAVWAMPDPNGQLSGPECMRLWIRTLCTAGSFINVFGNVDRPGPVKFGWRTIHPRRMETPPQSAGDPLVQFGVRLNEWGRPTSYYIRRPDLLQFTLPDHVEYREGVVQHRFEAIEPEQITGIPWLTSCLETIADLRDFDRYVMQAAKNQAGHTMGLEAKHPELVAEPVDVTGLTYAVEPGMVNVAPAGWGWSTVQPTQPGAQYQSFRHERLRELGLALGMPLMMVLLSSSESNFSSAHYDGAVYMRRIKARQAWLERSTLNQFLEQIIAELVISGEVNRPAEYGFLWTWETPPYVNPEKQRKADRMAVEDGAMPLGEYAASLGYDFDDVVEQRVRENELLAAAGLPLPPVNRGNGQQPQDVLREAADNLDQQGSEIDAESVAAS